VGWKGVASRLPSFTSILVRYSEHLVVDPSLQEERVMDGRMSVVMNNFREICAVHKAGGVLLSAEQVGLVARGRRDEK
jgi:exosome complex RNA-binding protein Rrp42 (RNase PH superfamily)